MIEVVFTVAYACMHGWSVNLFMLVIAQQILANLVLLSSIKSQEYRLLSLQLQRSHSHSL